MKQVDAIFCADLHIREDIPECRTDDYYQAQMSKLQFIKDLARDNNCPVLCAGDMFDTWRCSVGLVYDTMTRLPNKMIVIPGQHELPYHRINQLKRSPLAVLHAAHKARVLIQSVWQGTIAVRGSAFGNGIPSRELMKEKPVDVVIAHTMMWNKEKPYPQAPDEGNAAKVLNNRPDIRTLVTGDNHIPFVVRKSGRLLVNCGSMMRMSVDQADYKPCVWLWNKEENDVQQIPLPVQNGVVDTIKHQASKERDKRVEDFVRKLGEIDVTLDFCENIRRRIEQDDISQTVQELVWRCIDVSN